MSGVWGDRLKVSIFGESHGPAIGVVIGGLPPGFKPDWDEVRSEMARRAPGRGALVTPRREDDEWEVLSGIFEGAAAGSPICAIIKNFDAKSDDYNRDLARPGHADLTAAIKYAGYADYRGGGHFSGRLTAPLVFAGSLARQVLRADGIEIGARIASIYDVQDAPAPPEDIVAASRTPPPDLPVLSGAAGARMAAVIADARDAGDSVGGVVECVALGVPPGWGEPFFRSIESAAAELIFSIPAVKGVEFGAGFGAARMRGSDANDQLRMGRGKAEYITNHSGGVVGGISTGQPVTVRVAIKPTPTISREQSTVNMRTGETVRRSFAGRHDPCVVVRAAPVVEACLALCLLDLKPHSSARENN
jgi:chorismate synthase